MNESDNKQYMVNITVAAVYVKTFAYFHEQKATSGPDASWHRNWVQVEADSIEHARCIGKLIGIQKFGYSYSPYSP